MLTFSLLILCLNIDALSYGIANGAKNRRFSFFYVLLVCFMSTIMFAIPLGISKYVFQYFDETICRIINGVILMAMGIFYMIPKKPNKLKKNKKNKKLNNSQKNNATNKTINEADNEAKLTGLNYSQNNLVADNKKNTHIPFSRCFCECLVISVDAMFTAFLSGFSENYFIFSVAFYALTNFLAIIIGNRVLYKLSSKLNFRLDYFSGFIFILLGVLKIIGF